MKEKNAFGGWYLIWILSKFIGIFVKSGKVMSARYVTVYLYEITSSESLTFYNPDEGEIFKELIMWLDVIDGMSGVEINFKNTLIVVRKEWISKVQT